MDPEICRASLVWFSNNHPEKVVLAGGQGMSPMKMAHPVCEIVFPNGVVVRLSGDWFKRKVWGQSSEKHSSAKVKQTTHFCPDADVLSILWAR